MAIVLLEMGDEIELLYIERAKRLDDPWSGHIAFPGGRPIPNDLTARATAERETLEEVGIDLECAQYLGQLDEVRGRTKPVIVSAFAFRLFSRPTLTPNSEVNDAFWFPLSQLRDSDRQTHHRFQARGLDEPVPAINLLGAGRPLLWGLTHRLSLQLLGLLDL